MEINIICLGDRSVGTLDDEATIRWDGIKPAELFDQILATPNAREECRTKVKELFQFLMGEQVQVRFDDECPACYTEGFDDSGSCVNKNCINYD